jgi:hypothetical protein
MNEMSVARRAPKNGAGFSPPRQLSPGADDDPEASRHPEARVLAEARAQAAVPRAMGLFFATLLSASLALDACVAAAWLSPRDPETSLSIFSAFDFGSHPPEYARGFAAASATRAAMASTIVLGGRALRSQTPAGKAARLAHTLVSAAFVVRAVVSEVDAACFRAGVCGPEHAALAASALLGLIQVFALEVQGGPTNPEPRRSVAANLPAVHDQPGAPELPHSPRRETVASNRKRSRGPPRS